MSMADDMRALTHACGEAYDQRRAGMAQIRREMAGMLQEQGSARRRMAREQSTRLTADVAALHQSTGALLAEHAAARQVMAGEQLERLAADMAALHQSTGALLAGHATARQVMAGELHGRLSSDMAALRTSGEAQRGELQAEIAETRKVWGDFEQSMTRRRSGPAPAPAPRAGADDLTQLRGVGAVTAARLAEAGLTSFAQVAGSTEPSLRNLLGTTGARADVAGWIKQARARNAG